MTVGSNKEYKESLEDKLDWDLLSQLHNAVLQIGGFCFKTKQIFLTVEVAVVGLLIKILNNELHATIFIAAIIILVIFWFLDSTAYFYQVKIRGVMDNIRSRILSRNIEDKQIITSSTSINMLQTIDEGRIEEPLYKRIFHAFVNHSMWLYLIVFLINISLFCLYEEGIL